MFSFFIYIIDNGADLRVCKENSTSQNVSNGKPVIYIFIMNWAMGHNMFIMNLEADNH
jgi:hypothetical protein